MGEHKDIGRHGTVVHSQFIDKIYFTIFRFVPGSLLDMGYDGTLIHIGTMGAQLAAGPRLHL